MLRKLISFSILLLLSTSLVACTSDNDNNKSNNTEKVEQSKDNNNTVKENESKQDDSSSTKEDLSSSKNKIEKLSEKEIQQIDTSNLDNTSIGWYFKPNDEHVPPTINQNLNFDLKDYSAYYTGPTNPESKSLYLTFDEGYENGYTTKILDVLAEKNVKAIFFVTSHYIESNPELIKRMDKEGHIVANHSKNHPAMPDKASNLDEFNNEFKDVEDKYKEVTGKEIAKVFRPPMGKYSQKSLAMTNNLGYKSIFWSFAYYDYDVDKQPTQEQALNKLMNHLHDGSIMLLHAVSKTNTEILGTFIDQAQAQGYEFKLFN